MQKRFANRSKTVVIQCKEGIIKFTNIQINIPSKIIQERARQELSKIKGEEIKSLHYMNYMLNIEIEEYEGDYYIKYNKEVEYDKVINWKEEY